MPYYAETGHSSTLVDNSKKKKFQNPIDCQNISVAFCKTIANVATSLTCTQIWLILLVDDRQCGYMTKLTQNKNKNQKNNYLKILNFTKLI